MSVWLDFGFWKFYLFRQTSYCPRFIWCPSLFKFDLGIGQCCMYLWIERVCVRERAWIETNVDQHACMFKCMHTPSSVIARVFVCLTHNTCIHAHACTQTETLSFSVIIFVSYPSFRLIFIEFCVCFDG